MKKNAALPEQTTSLGAGSEHAVRFQWDDAEPWNTETPNLYNLELELVDGNNKVVHQHTQRIGFRTVEFRPQDGLYVNGTKVVLKGINRHSFHPDGGRTTNKEIQSDGWKANQGDAHQRRTISLCTDTHFLDVCDSLGIFVVNELAGWQNAYGTEIGSKLVKSLVTRDVNHPSIILWSNGNEEASTMSSASIASMTHKEACDPCLG